MGNQQRPPGCLNRESLLDSNDLTPPYVQMRSGHCFEPAAASLMVQDGRNTVTQQDLTSREAQCLQSFFQTGNLAQDCIDDGTLLLNVALPDIPGPGPGPL